MTKLNLLFCPNCGHKIEFQDGIFCPNCGTNLSNYANSDNSEQEIPVSENSEDECAATVDLKLSTEATDVQDKLLKDLANSVSDSSNIEDDSVFTSTTKTEPSEPTTASSVNNTPDKPKHTIKFKHIIIGMGIIVAAIIIAIAACMFAGVIDGAKIGIVNKEKAMEKIDTYLAEGSYEQCSDYAVLVQKRKNSDKEFLKELVYKITPICPAKAYEMVLNYAEKNSSATSDTDIKKWLEIGEAPAQEPVVTPIAGTYIYPPVIKVSPDNILIGHGIYYTTNGSEPDLTSQMYYNGIDISGDCTLKIVSINGNGEKSDTVTLVYEIDGTMQKQIDDMLEKATTALNNAVVGDEIGQCLESCKDDLQNAYNSAMQKLNSNESTLETGNFICKDLNDKILALEESKVVEVDKTTINSTIENAAALYDSNVNGAYSIYLENNLPTFLESINSAKELVNSRNPKQSDIDSMNSELQTAIDNFNKAIETVKIDLKYGSFRGTYSYYHNRSNDNLSVSVDINKVSDGKVYGSYYIYHGTKVSDSYNTYKYVYSETQLDGIALVDGKFSFDISGTSTYDKYDFWGYSSTETKEYTSNVTINMVEDGIIQVSMTNIGDKVKFNETLYRN